MNILYIGDIFGEKGIQAIETFLPILRKKYNLDLVFANAENVTRCRGLNNYHYQQLKKLGIDYFSMGNHTWKQKDYDQVLSESNIVRPGNIPRNSEFYYAGVSNILIHHRGKTIRLINLLGPSVYHWEFTPTNPFLYLEKLLNNITPSDITIVDFHAETTSEKNAMLLAFKQRVQLIVGTHTHVQTNDQRIYEGTAYISDLGLTGPCDGIIGANPETIINKFFEKSTNFRLTEASGKYQISAVFVNFDDVTNLPTKIENILLKS